MKGLKWHGNVSHSAFSGFKDCERRHFYEKILKIPYSNKVETKYGRFGNCVHEAIENFQFGKTHTKQLVEKYWEKYKLNDTNMSFGSALKQVEYAINLNYDFKHKEELILFEIDKLKFNLIIDGTLRDGSILDWKTSTFEVKKIGEYKKQLLFYAWGTWKKKGYIPPKAILVFTKAEKVFDWSFTEKEILSFEKHIEDTIKYYNTKTTFKDYSPNYESCFFCGYKAQCRKDDIIHMEDMKVELEYDHDNVYIKTPMPSDFNELISNELSYELDNAYFIKKEMSKKGIKNYDAIVRMYRKQSCPIGFLNYIRERLMQYGEHKKIRVILDEKDLRVINHKTIKVPNKLSGVTLRKYQIKAVEHIIDDKISMTEICTGAGKTIIAAEIIRRLAKKTLFVVDRNVLLNQTMREFEKHFGASSLGSWTEGNYFDGDIVVASIQTINKFKDLDRFTEFGVVIIDEAHGAKAKSYQNLMKKIDAEYRIGLTGTAYSDGNNSLELYKSFGFPDFKIRAIDLINEGYLVMPEISFLDYDEGFIMNGSYDEVYNHILKCEGRLKYLEGLSVIHKNNNMLIMCDRIEHIQLVNTLNLDPMNVNIITGTTSKKNREKIIDRIKNKKGQVLIATSSIIQKGVDIPTLDVIVNYSANLGSVKTIQSLGRVLRKSEGKTKAYYYDFNDTHRMLKKHTQARKDALKNQGYKING